MKFSNWEDISSYYNKLNTDKSHFNSTNDICTPMGCVKEMVDAVPEEFWNREGATVLDPCAGNGNFLAYALLKNKGNTNFFANDINPVRLNNLKTFFDAGEVTIMEKDFLTFSNNQKYDLIIANPPFAKFTKNGERAAKNHTLSRDFLMKAISLTNDNGYLCFILPDNWMSYADRNTLPSLLTSFDILTLNIGEAKKWFPGVGSSFTYFVLHKVPHTGRKTKIITTKGIENVEITPNIPCIPLQYNEAIKGIFEKVVFNNEEKYSVETSSQLHKYTHADWLVDKEDEKHPYRVIHTPNQTIWSKVQHKYHEGWKIFLPTTTYYRPFVDCNVGMTQSIAFIRCEGEQDANNQLQELSQKVYKVVVDLTRYGNFNNQRVLQHLSKFNTFKLTPEEQAFVDNYKLKY
jgi:predicted RNA methylase